MNLLLFHYYVIYYIIISMLGSLLIIDHLLLNYFYLLFWITEIELIYHKFRLLATRSVNDLIIIIISFEYLGIISIALYILI